MPADSLNMSTIGFQGMSINSGKLVAPALQGLLGGGRLGNGRTFADKVIKIPNRRGRMLCVIF